jgi:hypothetical protein
VIALASLAVLALARFRLASTTNRLGRWPRQMACLLSISSALVGGVGAYELASQAWAWEQLGQLAALGDQRTLEALEAELLEPATSGTRRRAAALLTAHEIERAQQLALRTSDLRVRRVLLDSVLFDALREPKPPSARLIALTFDAADSPVAINLALHVLERLPQIEALPTLRLLLDQPAYRKQAAKVLLALRDDAACAELTRIAVSLDVDEKLRLQCIANLRQLATADAIASLLVVHQRTSGTCRDTAAAALDELLGVTSGSSEERRQAWLQRIDPTRPR